MDEDLLYKTIVNRLIEEDEELTSLMGFGLFYAPELYISFLIGKELKKNDIQVFGQKAEWIRETKFGNGGPTDFAFRTDSKIYAFELKIRSTIDAYGRDIVKLKKLDDAYSKYFIAIVDSWAADKSKDGRIVALETKYPDLRRVSPLVSFPTMQSIYKGEINCTVGLWTFKY